MCVRVLNVSVQIVNVRSVPDILPLFRSLTQFRVLGELFTHPTLETTVTELAQRIGAPRPSVSRELARLARSGLVVVRKDAQRTFVRGAVDSPVGDDLRSLLDKVYGPHHIIRTALASVPGVTAAYIFGSWAARWQGTPGPVPRDVDLLVIGDAAPDDVWTVAAALSRRLGMEVSPLVRTASEWEADASGFAAVVKSSPLVEVTPTGSAGS